MFDPTNWSVILAAGAEHDVPAQRAALTALLEKYWRPLYVFSVQSGQSHHDAQDLVQGFFARLVGQGSLAKADPTRGRFRNFLLTAFKHFSANERERDQRQKRGGGFEFISVAAMLEGGFGEPAGSDPSPELAYERRWAHAVVEAAVRRTEREYARRQRGAIFERLREFITAEGATERYEIVAEELGLAAGTVKVEVFRLRREFREQLRAEVAANVTEPGEIEDEIRHLRLLLSSR